MSNVAIVYWSGTGNTEAMAKLVAMGVKSAGSEVQIFTASEFDDTQLERFDAVAFGCPAMGGEELEESEFAPMFESCQSKLQGKRIGLFGSYGWGDGEWMRIWEDTCRNAGADLVSPGVICADAPDGEAEAACAALGQALVQ
jgi:flavodoxin short chain